MTRTELLYFVKSTTSGWMVECEDQCAGPYPDFQDAFEDAVDEAAAAGQCGFASMVLVPVGTELFRVQWTYGEDPYPLPYCGRA